MDNPEGQVTYLNSSSDGRATYRPWHERACVAFLSCMCNNIKNEADRYRYTSFFMVDLKRFELSTSRMRTERSPKRCSSMHHKPHRKLPTIIRYCRRKAKKVYGLVQFFTVQAKKQASCDNQAIFPYYTPPICEMSTQWRRYSSHRGKGMLKNEDFGRYVRIQKHARQSVLFYYHRR